MSAAWGRLVHRYRWPVLVLSVLSLAPSAWLIARGGEFENNPLPRSTESGRAVALIERELPKKPPSFGLILGSARLRAADPAFREAVERTLAPLRADPRMARVVTPYDATGPAPQHVSRDDHRILVTVELKGGPSEFAALNLGRPSQALRWCAARPAGIPPPLGLGAVDGARLRGRCARLSALRGAPTPRGDGGGRPRHPGHPRVSPAARRDIPARSALSRHGRSPQPAVSSSRRSPAPARWPSAPNRSDPPHSPSPTSRLTPPSSALYQGMSG